MKLICILSLIAAAIVATSCAGDNPAPDNRVTIIGSGRMVTQEIAASGFDRLDIGFAFDVTIRQGEKYKVVATVDDNLAGYLHLVTTGDTLQIGLKPGYAYDVPAATMRAEVVMPRLAGLALSGSSHATLLNVGGAPEFTAELSGSSALEGRLDAQVAGFTLTGSTLARLSGGGQRVTINVCGNSVVDLRGFQVKDAAVEASCNATVYLNLDGQLIADTSQFAQVIYRGQPDLRAVEMVERASVRPE